jgi:membrane-bound metal-dependent hydrolase YbcI (DUF457 family)
MTHQITGIGAAAVSAAALDVPSTAAAVLVGAAWLGSMLPDADRAGAHVYQRTRLERRHLSARLAGALVRLPLRLLVLLPHRGITHSLFACALATTVAGALVSFVAPELALAAAAGAGIGYAAHLAGDACTPGGVALWAPLSRRRRWLLPACARIPTGSLREIAAAVLLAAISLAAIVVLTG